MFEELSRCAPLLQKYGGHPMAAGLSLSEENIGPLREALNENCTLTEKDFVSRVTVDAAMPLGYISEKLICDIESLAPFGKGNPEPLFALKNIRAEAPRLLGAKKNVLKMRLTDENGTAMDGICFRDAEAHYERIRMNPVIMIAYVPKINEYNGIRTLQAEIRHLL